ncbi:MAG: hypothetical protein C5B49_12030 [Bdellovibrio sp.]|nr:MAG: hypothetical protein C5B49_12030 [Bdellovibrio sp.]
MRSRLINWPVSWLVTLGLPFVLSGCISIPAPIEEYALARAAMDGAKSVDAARFAPGYYHRALEAYSKAEVLYEQREYQDAKELFNHSRIDFEKAENAAHVQRKKSGEVL